MTFSERPRILVVDDQAGPRESLRILLKDRFEVLTAAGGEEGLRLAAAERPDLVFMDIRMPELNGVEALQRLKAMDPTIEVVMITAYASLDTVKNALRFGALDYLVKPFGRRDVEDAVERALTRRREHREADQLAELGKQMQGIARDAARPSLHADLTQVLTTIVEEAGSSLEAAGVGLFLYEGSAVSCRYARGLPERYSGEMAERLRVHRIEAGPIVDRVLVLSRDAAQNAYSVLLEGTGYGRAALFFLTADGTTLGLLVLYYGRERVLYPRELEMLRAFADMAAVAIRNNQLHEIAKREATAHAMRAVQLGILREIGRAAAAQLDREALISGVTGQLARGLGYDRVVILPLAPREEWHELPERVVCPIGSQTPAQWVLVADNRPSGRIIGEPDREILRMCAEHLGIAFRNALLYEEIKTAKGRFETLIESAGEAIVAVGVDGRIESWNPKAGQVFLYDREEIVGQPIDRLFPRDVYRDGVQRLVEAGRSHFFEIRAHRKDGTTIEVGVILSAIPGPNREFFGVLALIRDITEQKLMEEQFIQSEKLTALGQLAGGIAHDFNNLLQAIIGYTQLASRHLSEPDAVRKWLGVIEAAARDGSETVRRIHEFSRTRPEVELVPLDLNEAIRESLEIIRPRWNEKMMAEGVEIVARLDLGAIPSVRGRPAEIREVFTNLLLNALDAMPSGGEITIRTRREGDAVLVSVADRGVGMPEEVRRRAFDPFFTTKGDQGTGLGLSVSYSIVTRHGGKIWVESREGNGTVFTVRLPAYSGEVLPQRPVPPARRGRPGRILVIEDDPRVNDLLGDLLKEAGHTVTGTSNGEEAISLLEKESFDLVITDLGMPGISGWEVIERIRERDPKIPVVVLTGWGLKGEEDRRRLRELGVSRCLFKPVRIQELLQTITDLFGNHRQKR